MNQINLEEMSDVELAALVCVINEEINCRKEEQFQNLVSNLLQAYNDLVSAFPDAACNMSLLCEDCYTTFPINMLHLFNNLRNENFSR